MRKLDFREVNNDLFAEHSWYFRNALVRANCKDLSKNIYKTEKYLFQFLLNLLKNENHSLKNRELHVQYIDSVNLKNEPVKAMIDLVRVKILQQLRQKQNANYTEIADKTGYSIATIKRHIQELKKLGLIERIGSDKTGYWKITEKTKL